MSVTFATQQASNRQTRIFPLRLPPNFHGQPAPKPAPYYTLASSQVLNPEPYFTKSISNWQRRRLDKDVVQERTDKIVHPGLISNEMPQWVQGTAEHFLRRHSFKVRSIQRQTMEQMRNPTHDVFNRPRAVTKFTNGIEDGSLAASNFWTERRQDVTPKVGEYSTKGFTERTTSIHSQAATGRSWRPSQQVANKVGSLDVRNFNQRLIPLKVGSQLFVDTNTPF